MGAEAWVASEPPLAIGRGLSAATGAVGGILALAVLWTMLPTHAGRSAGVTVRSTVATILGTTTSPASSFGADTTVDETTTTDPVASSSTPDTTVATPTSVEPSIESTGTPGTNRPLPTYVVSQSTTLELGAVAVAVNGSLVITTAEAVAADNTVDLMLPDGGTERAHVLLVDQRSGLAVLAHDTASSVESFTVARSLDPGDILSFYGNDTVSAVVAADGSITTNWGSDQVREGTPVVNQRGELVALCSHDADGAALVSLANLDELRRALSASGSSPVWMGVVVSNGSGGTLSVSSLDPKGPAAAAGIAEGDVITSIGGIAVHDSASLSAALALHVPGDSVVVVVQRASAALATPSTTTFSVNVVLAPPKNSL